MGTLAELGLSTADGSVLLVDPPPSVTAEAAGVKPRPGVVPSIHTARPAATIAWWPTREQLTPAAMGRLAWLASAGGGQAWVIVDPSDDECPTLDVVRESVGPGGLTVGQERRLLSGEVALAFSIRASGEPAV